MQQFSSVLNKRVFYILFILFAVSQAGNAQPETITINGRAVNKGGLGGLYQVIVINQRTSSGMLAEPNGHFSISCLKTDTILVSASGFDVKKICFRDSAAKNEFNVTIKLDSIHYKLEEVKVYPTKGLKDVNEERKTLGDIPNTDVYKSADIQSPITLLYERFSRLEQSKRKVAQLEDEEKRRDVLKELFHIYIQHDIINLNNADFDRFIDYCNFSDEFIRNSTDYDLVMAIKYKYEQFEKMHDYAPPGSKQ